jgi:hypothetical protein
MEEQIKKEYHDWVSLLIRTNNKDLLRDPFTVWEEAWHVATVIANKKIPTDESAG